MLRTACTYDMNTMWEKIDKQKINNILYLLFQATTMEMHASSNLYIVFLISLYQETYYFIKPITVRLIWLTNIKGQFVYLLLSFTMCSVKKGCEQMGFIIWSYDNVFVTGWNLKFWKVFSWLEDQIKYTFSVEK